MPDLTITADLDAMPWSDLPELGDVDPAVIERVGLMPAGMQSGDPAFLMVVRLPDGTRVPVQTSWRLMRSALQSLDVNPLAPKLRDLP